MLGCHLTIWSNLNYIGEWVCGLIPHAHPTFKNALNLLLIHYK